MTTQIPEITKITKITKITTISRTTTKTIPARIGLFLTVGVLVLFAGGYQAAQAAPKRLGVVAFRGPGEGVTRNVVMKEGKARRYQVIAAPQIWKASVKTKVGFDNDDAFQTMARELGISAFITGSVTKKKATLTVRNGADGSVVAEASWTGANPRKVAAAVKKTFWAKLGGAIDRSKAPSGAKAPVVAQEEAAPETGADEAGNEDKGKSGSGGGSKKAAAVDESSSSDRDRSKKKSSTESSEDSGAENVVAEHADREGSAAGPAQEALIASVGPRLVNRSLIYNQNLYNQTRNYKLAVAPELALNVDLYPMAFSGGGFLSNIGLTANLNYLLPLVTTPVTGVGTYKTYALDWSIGVKVRFSFGGYLTAAFGDQRYQLTKPNTQAADVVPMVDYRFARIGGGGRFPLSTQFTLLANVAYLQVLSMGQIASSSYFPKAKAMGVEAGAAIGYRITQLLELQAGADLRRYGLAFNVTYADYVANNNIKVAGGAVDQYISGWLGIAMILGGETRASASHSADEEAPAGKASGDEEEGDDSSKKKKKGDDDEEE